MLSEQKNQRHRHCFGHRPSFAPAYQAPLTASALRRSVAMLPSRIHPTGICGMSGVTGIAATTPHFLSLTQQPRTDHLYLYHHHCREQLLFPARHVVTYPPLFLLPIPALLSNMSGSTPETLQQPIVAGHVPSVISSRLTARINYIIWASDFSWCKSTGS